MNAVPAPRIEVHEDADDLATTVAGAFLRLVSVRQAGGEVPQVALICECFIVGDGEVTIGGEPLTQWRHGSVPAALQEMLRAFDRSSSQRPTRGGFDGVDSNPIEFRP